jgi:tetratricopeptide (TPR) repeat protein
MKLVVMLFFIVGVCAAVYIFLIHIKNFKKIHIKALIISGIFGIILVTLLGIGIYKGSTAPDTWCTSIRNTTSYPPVELKTAMDYFEKGNYEYDRGNCKQAVADYAKSIQLNGKYPQAYNNKAYTEMRMQNFNDAITDLNRAIEIKPDYVNALMNRGDIYNNYLKNKSMAVADYKKVVALGASGSNVCGRLYFAEHDGWNLYSIIGIPLMMMDCN